MSLTLSIQTGSTVSIYRQIVEQVCAAALAGRIREDEPLPSVRGLAEQLVINPNTVSRAYGELVREGISKRGRGAGCSFAPPPDLQCARARAPHGAGRHVACLRRIHAWIHSRANRRARRCQNQDARSAEDQQDKPEGSFAMNSEP